MSEFRGGHFLAIFFGGLFLAAGSCATFVQSESTIAAALFFLALITAISAALIRIFTRGTLRVASGVGRSLISGGVGTLLAWKMLDGMFVSKPHNGLAFLVIGFASIAGGIALLFTGRQR